MERARHRRRAAPTGAHGGHPALGSHRFRALVIAHRGASGYLPEHTLEAKALAYGFGSDYLEQDVVATRDGRLVVLHDTYLDEVSDVAARFPGRARADGRHYVIDFDLAELRRLRLTERGEVRGRPAWPGRFRSEHSVFRIATLEQEIELVRELNRITGRRVGLYTEIKAPAEHREHGIDLGALVLETLARHGYTEAADAVFVQCFSAPELLRLREALGTRLELVQLVEPGCRAAGPAGGWPGVAAYASAVGCAYTDLVAVRDRGRKLAATPLAEAVHGAGLAVHAYTLRRDALGAFRGRFEELLRFLLHEVGVEAVFTDHPDIALRVAAEAS